MGFINCFGPKDRVKTFGTHFFSLESKFPLTILLTFASEGDNRGDALRLVEYYNEWAQLVKLYSATTVPSLFAESSILMLCYYLAPLQNDAIVTSRCMQFTFGDKGEVNLLDESALLVTGKERRREGKSSMGPRMQYGHSNQNSVCPYERLNLSWVKAES